MEIVTLAGPHRTEVDAYIRENWSGPYIVTLGEMYDTRPLPGFAAVEGDTLLGALLYRETGGSLEVSALCTLRRGKGAGTALLNTVLAYARERGLSRVWLVTTNDNTPAIRFYQRYGFTLARAHIGTFAEIMRLKNIPDNIGIDGIAIEHELEFEILL